MNWLHGGQPGGAGRPDSFPPAVLEAVLIATSERSGPQHRPLQSSSGRRAPPSQPHFSTVTIPDVSPIRTFTIRLNSLNFLQILLGPDMVGISSHIH